jgi:hypothetical protein
MQNRTKASVLVDLLYEHSPVIELFLPFTTPVLEVFYILTTRFLPYNLSPKLYLWNQHGVGAEKNEP